MTMAKDDNHHSTVCVSQNSHGHFVAEQNSYAHPHFGPGQCQASSMPLIGWCMQAKDNVRLCLPNPYSSPQCDTHTAHEYSRSTVKRLGGCVVQDESDCREPLKGGGTGLACLAELPHLLLRGPIHSPNHCTANSLHSKYACGQSLQ